VGCEPFQVSDASKVVVSPGEEVVLTGKNFRSTLTVADSGLTSPSGLKVTVMSDTKASLRLADTAGFGLVEANLTQDGVSQKLTLFSNGGRTDYPVITASADQICQGMKFYDFTGTLQDGTKVCGPLGSSISACQTDGQVGCVTTSSFKAADMSRAIEGNILLNKTIAGTIGNVVAESHSDCSSNGTQNCVAAGSFRAATACNAEGSNCFVPSYNVGTQPLKAVSIAAIDAGKGSIRESLTLAGVSGTLADCATDGQTGCVSVPAYKAVQMSKLTPSVVKYGTTIASVEGLYPSVGYPLEGSTPSTEDLPAFTNTTGGSTYEWFRSDGTRLTGSIQANETRSSTTSDQTLNAGLYRSVTITGDANLTAPNIKSETMILGVEGSYNGVTTPSCSVDGDTNCVVSGIFKAANTTGMSAWDLRVGKTLAGYSGALKTNCRNTVNSSIFNYDGYDGAVGGLGTGGVTSGTAFDYWDTIDDYYGFPSSRVTAWSTDTYCDSSTWLDRTTTDGGTSFTNCGTSSTCIYQDRITNLQVTGILASGGNTTNTTTPATYAWNTAVQACAASTYGGYSAGTWRLPTQKELMSLYEHGIASIVGSSFITLTNMQTDNFWSSSTYSYSTSVAWYVLLAGGETNASTKGANNYVVCVR
jgi:hypothetical protein